MDQSKEHRQPISGVHSRRMSNRTIVETWTKDTRLSVRKLRHDLLHCSMIKWCQISRRIQVQTRVEKHTEIGSIDTHLNIPTLLDSSAFKYKEKSIWHDVAIVDNAHSLICISYAKILFHKRLTVIDLAFFTMLHVCINENNSYTGCITHWYYLLLASNIQITAKIGCF